MSAVERGGGLPNKYAVGAAGDHTVILLPTGRMSRDDVMSLVVYLVAVSGLRLDDVGRALEDACSR